MLLPPEIVELIPPTARYHRIPLADEDNAYGLWEEAAQKYVPYDDRKLSPYFWSDTKAFPRGKLGHSVKAWLDVNQDVIELYCTGARLRGWQLPEGDEQEDQVNFERVQSMRPMNWLLQTHVRRCLADGQISEAAQAAIDLMKAGRFMCCANGGTACHSLGSAFSRVGIECVRETAIHQGATSQHLEILATAVDELVASDDGFVSSCQRELIDQLRDVLKFPECGDAELLTNHLLANLYSHEAGWEIDRAKRTRILEAIEADGRLGQRDRDVRFLLGDHPFLFDRSATIKLIADEVHKVVTLYPLGWEPLATRLEYHTSALEGIWPLQLAPGFPVKYLGRSEPARLAWDEEKDWYGCDAVYPTQEELDSLREKLRSVPNPIGWLRRGHDHGISLLHFSFRTQAQLLLLRVVLALCTFRLRHGKLPTQLSVLVTEGMLGEIPNDPFDGQPLRYCRRRQIVWSVGEDGIDGDGEPSEWGEVYSTKDIVMSARLDSRWQEWRDYWTQWRTMRQPYEDVDEAVRRIHGD